MKYLILSISMTGVMLMVIRCDLGININWHLTFAPKPILEYVVAHEVCHLQHRNHSKKFWELLGSIFPNDNECKTWLEKNEKVWETRI